MNNFIFYTFFIFSFSSYFSFSQSSEILIVEAEPEYPGGTKEFQNYILKNFNLDSIPEIKTGLCTYTSKFYFEFVINEDGTISNIKLLRPAEYISVEKEMRRIMQNTLRWIPKKENGKAVKTKMIIPLNICYK